MDFLVKLTKQMSFSLPITKSLAVVVGLVETGPVGWLMKWFRIILEQNHQGRPSGQCHQCHGTGSFSAPPWKSGADSGPNPPMILTYSEIPRPIWHCQSLIPMGAPENHNMFVIERLKSLTLHWGFSQENLFLKCHLIPKYLYLFFFTRI